MRSKEQINRDIVRLKEIHDKKKSELIQTVNELAEIDAKYNVQREEFDRIEKKYLDLLDELIS